MYKFLIKIQTKIDKKTINKNKKKRKHHILYIIWEIRTKWYKLSINRA